MLPNLLKMTDMIQRIPSWILLPILICSNDLLATPSIDVQDNIFNVDTGGSLHISLSDVAAGSSIAGVNFQLILPQGMDATLSLPDALAASGFQIQSRIDPDTSVVSAVVYGLGSALIDADQTVIELTLNYSSGEVHSLQQVTFAETNSLENVNANHALSNSDGSVSLPHSFKDGRLFLISNTSDFDGDEIADVNDDDIDGDGVTNEEELANNTSPIDPNDFFMNNQRYVFADYDGDGKADVWVRNIDTSINYIRAADDGAINRVTFGLRAEDIPVLGDYDGDGKTDVAVRRPSQKFWYIKNSSGRDLISGNSDGITRRSFGSQSTDIPVPADYNGDGITDIAVRRPSSQFWYVLNSPGAQVNYNSDREDGIQRVRFGTRSEDIPVPCDYNGDGIDDFAVRRPSTQFWYVKNSAGENVNYNSDRQDGIQRVRFGLQSGDIPVPADYDGDNICDFAVRRPSNQFFYVRRSSDGNILRANFGRQSTDIPIAADYDGDGKADVAVRRGSNFHQYILNSSDGQIQRIVFGRNASYVPMQAPIHTIMDFMTDGDVSNRGINVQPVQVNDNEAFFIEQTGLVVEIMGPGFEEELGAGNKGASH